MLTDPNPDDYGMVVLNITRKQIEAFDHLETLSFLNLVKENALKYEGKLNIWISGYDNDERELNEIIEVKIFFDFLDRCFPYWFFFLIRTLPPIHSPFITLISLLVPIQGVPKKDANIQTVFFDIPKLHDFINIHFEFFNELADQLGLSEEVIQRISKEIFANIKVA
jgi:hypothetical protein